MTTENTATSNEAVKPKKAAPVITTVTMNDGKVVEFVGKRKMLKSSWVDETTGKLYSRFDFINGETRTFEIPQRHVAKAATHGWEQKFGDEVAGETEVDDMVEAIDNLAGRLVDDPQGSWNQPREAGDSFSGASFVIRGMCQVTGKSKDEIKSYLEKKLAEGNSGTNDKGEPNKLTRQGLYKIIRGSKKYGETIAKLEAEKQAKTKGPDVDLDDLE
jgi:hypothetical protein